MERNRPLNESAFNCAVDWAQHVFCRYVMWQKPLPREWPGTLDQAETLAREFSRGIDSDVGEALVMIIQTTAEAVWREFIRSPGVATEDARQGKLSARTS